MEEKIAWVIPGGGSRSAYTAGLIYAADKYKFKKPDMIITASGGAGASCYYLAEQADDIKYIWLKCITLRDFKNIWRFWKIADIDFLVDQVFKKIKPLNIEKITSSKTILYIAVNDYKTGEIKFFTNRDNENMWEIIRATKSAPVFSGLKQNLVKIRNNYYGDSRVTSHSELLIQKSIQQGAQKIIVFDNYHKWSSFLSGDLSFRIWLLFKNRKFRQKQLEYLEFMNNYQSPRERKIIIIKPKKRLSISAWSNSEKKLEKIFFQGVADFKNFYSVQSLKN